MLRRKVPVRTTAGSSTDVTYAITRNTSAACEPPVAPINEKTGEPFPLAMQFNGGWLYCWAEDVEECVAALVGNASYLDESDQQARLIMRVKAAMRLAVVVQAEQIHEAQCDKRWERLTEAEKAMLFQVRIAQPKGLYEDLFGAPWWTADVPLVVVSTGYEPWVDQPLPMGGPDRVWVIDPLTPEDTLSSLADLGVIRLFQRGADV